MLGSCNGESAAKKPSTKHFAFQTVIAIALLAASRLADAQTAPPYLAEMPTVERVRADVQGRDRLDTLARQKAAFEQMFRVVGIAAGPRQYSGLTPAEQRWRDTYRGAANSTRKEAYSGLSNSPPQGLNPFAKSPLEQWNALTAEYERDPKARDALLRKYFSNDAYSALSAAVSEDEASRAGLSDLAHRFGPQTGSRGLLAHTLFWLVLAVMALAFVREFLAFGASPRNPLRLRAGLRSYRLQWTTGRVADCFKRSDREGMPQTTVFRDIYGNVTHSSGPTLRENVHEYFSLVGDDGQRHIVYLVNSGIELPEGHVATAVWAASRGGPTYLVLFDRTLSNTWPVTKALARMLGVGRAMYLPALAIAVVVGSGLANVAGGVSETFGALGGLFIGGIGTAIVFMLITGRRVRRFMRKDAPRVLAAIEKSGG